MEGRGQAALTKPLLSTAECAYGGPSIGRGYIGGVLSGDSCLMGLIELRYDQPSFGQQFQVYAFVDGGVAWHKGELAGGEARSDAASSSGIGLRFGIRETVEGDIQAAVPLRASLTEGGKGGARLFLGLKVMF